MAAEAGLKSFEVDSMAPSDVWISIDGYNERMKGEWERTRFMCFFIHSHSMMDKKYKKNKPQKLMPFPWDKQRENGPRVFDSPAELLEYRRKQREENQRAKREKTIKDL